MPVVSSWQTWRSSSLSSPRLSYLPSRVASEWVPGISEEQLTRRGLRSSLPMLQLAPCPMLWDMEAEELPPASWAGATDTSGSRSWSKDRSSSSAVKYIDLSHNACEPRTMNSPMSTTLPSHRHACCQYEKTQNFLQNLRWPFWKCNTRLLGKKKQNHSPRSLMFWGIFSGMFF